MSMPMQQLPINKYHTQYDITKTYHSEKIKTKPQGPNFISEVPTVGPCSLYKFITSQNVRNIKEMKLHDCQHTFSQCFLSVPYREATSVSGHHNMTMYSRCEM